MKYQETTSLNNKQAYNLYRASSQSRPGRAFDSFVMGTRGANQWRSFTNSIESADKIARNW